MSDPIARHVRLDASVQPHLMRCDHCGETAVLSLPMPIGAAVKRMNAFVQLHEDCPAPTPEVDAE